MGEKCSDGPQDVVSQGRHLGNLSFFFKKYSEKHVCITGVQCGFPGCGGDRLNCQHRDAKGRPTSGRRAFSGWWPKPGETLNWSQGPAERGNWVSGRKDAKCKKSGQERREQITRWLSPECGKNACQEVKKVPEGFGQICVDESPWCCGERREGDFEISFENLKSTC